MNVDLVLGLYAMRHAIFFAMEKQEDEVAIS